MAKKIFFFSLGFLVLILIFLGAYNLAFKNNVNNPVADPAKKTASQDSGAPQFTPEGMAENPVNEAVLGATIGDDNMLYYYSIDDQSLKKATLEGKNKTILLSNLPGEVMRLLWSTKKDKVLLLLQQGDTPLWYFSHLGNKTLVPLKSEISRLSWDNFGEKIFYQYTDPLTGDRSLNMANADGSEWKRLTNLGAQDFFLAAIPSSSAVSFWNRPRAHEPSLLKSISTTGESLKTLVSGVFGGDYLWSPNGERVLYQGNEDSKGKGISLHIMESDGETKSLSIPTIISKTVWSKDSRALYYALPGGLPDGTLFPDDYNEKNLHSRDTFWKIDLDTGKKTRIVNLKESTQSLDSTDLFLPVSEDALYFTDRATKRLYRISL